MGILTDKIHSSRFDISKKGYDKEQVDEFLDSLILELEKVEKESADQKEEIAKFRDMQDGITRAMVSVQSTADTLLNEAKTKAEAFKREAEAYMERAHRDADAYRDRTIAKAKYDAENILREKQEDYNRLTAEIRRLSGFAERFKEAIKSDIQRFADTIDGPQTSDKVFEECPAFMDMEEVREEKACELEELEEERPLYVEDVMKQVQETDETEEAPQEQEEEETKDDAEDPLFDLGEIMKNLPETDSELKAMIDEML